MKGESNFWILPAILLTWFGAMYVFSVIGGWMELGHRFAANQTPSGKRFLLQSAKVGNVSYGGMLTVWVSSQGLHLSIWMPFAVGHQPVLIPWDQIQVVSTTKVFWYETVKFDVGSPRIATIELLKKVFAHQPAAT
jgi:hypothetical protein